MGILDAGGANAHARNLSGSAQGTGLGNFPQKTKSAHAKKKRLGSD
jgi:hypothetical protein